MVQVELAIKLTVAAPFSTRSSEMGRIGVDAPLAQVEGRPYVPGTLVKGRLRQSWRELHSVAGELFNPNVDQLLGRAAANEMQQQDGSVGPYRGRLLFSDFSLVEDLEKTPEITRIEIDPDLGSVKKGSFQVIETPCASGGLLMFKGSVRYFSSDSAGAKQIRSYVETGLRWTTGLGAERTVGFGRMVDVAVEEIIASAANTETVVETPTSELYLMIHFAGAFCVAKRRISDNLFQSDSVIPGAVLKGAMAFNWSILCGKQEAMITEGFDADRAELSRHFDKVRFSQALPCPAEAKLVPVFPPLSLVKAGGRVYDVLLCEGPQLIGGEAPAFSIDWKEDTDVRNEFGWPEIKTQLRVRTAISETQRRAEESMLFAYEQVQPGDLLWHARIDLSRVPESDRGRVAAQLRSLLDLGIHAMGKTKVSGQVQIGDSMAHACGSAELEDDLYAIGLQSPAILCDPQLIQHGSRQEELHQAYSTAWDDLSSGTLKLVRYFARQSLAGGFYLHRRFQSGKNYAPWLLTDPGSVFLLRKQSGGADALVQSWLKSGLPLPSWAAARYGNHWTTCPYLAENGYGEIVVNLDIHQKKRPESQ